MSEFSFIILISNFWITVTQSLTISITASVIFLVLLFVLRPNIKIAKKISYHDNKYCIKTISRSFIRLYDIKFQLTIKHSLGNPGGKNVRYTRLKLKHDTKLTYPRRPFFEKKSEFFEHAVLVTIDDDVRQIWTNESDTLEFIVIAKHGLSSFAKIYRVEYQDKGTDIVDGKFKWGNTMEIVPV